MWKILLGGCVVDEEELGHEEINKRILRKLEKIKNRIDSSMQKYEESRKNMNNQKKMKKSKILKDL